MKFGTWDNAKEIIGLKMLGQNNYTIEDCILSLKNVDSCIDIPLSPSTYSKNKSKNDPSVKEIRYWFDTWTDAKKKADLDMSQHIDKYSRKECIKALKFVKKNVDEPLTVSVYMENKMSVFPTRNTISNKIGSWNMAKKEAGIDIIKKNNYSEEECIESLIYVANELGESPSQSQYTDIKPIWAPSTSYMDYKFKNWNEAKKMADLSIFKNDGDNVNYPYGPNWNTQRKKALNRDNHECVLCGISNKSHISNNDRGLDVHHIYKLRNFYYLLNDKHIKLLKSEKDSSKLYSKIKIITKKANHISNLVSLCRNCHLSRIEPQPIQKQISMLNVNYPKFEP